MPSLSSAQSFYPRNNALVTEDASRIGYRITTEIDAVYDLDFSNFPLPNGDIASVGYVQSQFVAHPGTLSLSTYVDFAVSEVNRYIVAKLDSENSSNAKIDFRIYQDSDFSFNATAGVTVARRHVSLNYTGPSFGDVWINASVFGRKLETEKRSIVLHELMHALGAPGHRDIIYSAASNDFERLTLGLYDVAGLQNLYGADYSYRTGSDIYDGGEFGGGDLFSPIRYYTIWDGGGTDKIDASSFGESIIDLRQGEFSSIGGNFFSSFLVGPIQNVAVAWGAVIENATGSSEGDLIIGNRTSNEIVGGDGDDAIFGDGASYASDGGKGRAHLSAIGGAINVGDKGTGDDWEHPDHNGPRPTAAEDADTLKGGEGDDLIFAGSGDDIVDGGDDDDELHGGSENDELDGGAGEDKLHGDENDDILRGGDDDDELHGGSEKDELRGDDGEDKLHGDAGEDKLYGGEEDDELHGGADKDELHGEAGKDELHGDAGDDTLKGGSEDDLLFGGSDNDELRGEQYNDELHGNDGIDKLYGGEGQDKLKGGGDADRLYGDDDEDESDELTGGSGADYFYAGNSDVVLDAKAADRIYLDGQKLTGGTMEVDEDDVGGKLETGTYKNDDGTEYSYSGDGDTLSVTNKDGASINIEKWKNGYGGIRLREDRTSDDQDEAEKQASPLVIDLDGDGLELTQLFRSNVFFDLDLDGFAERTSWVGSDDGLLAVDRDGDGIINNVSELFGSDPLLRPVDPTTPVRSGFSALADYDSNADGLISGLDARFGTLRVWRDGNGDGETDEGELHTLADLGIAAIDLRYARVDETAGSNRILDRSRATMADGSTREVSDVYFAIDQFDTVEVNTADADTTAEIAALPFLIGSGELSDLDVAMARDPRLKEMVEELVAITPAEMHAFMPRVQAIVLRWTGADEVAVDSRDKYVNGQWLRALEIINGEAFNQSGSVNPRPNAGTIAARGFQQFVAATASRLFGQLPLAQTVLPGLSFEVGAFYRAADGASAASLLAHAEQFAPSTLSQAIPYWSGILSVLGDYAEALGTPRGDFDAIADGFLAGRFGDISSADLRYSVTLHEGASHIGSSGWLDPLLGNLYNVAGSQTSISDIAGNDTYVVSSRNTTVSIVDYHGDDEFVLGVSRRSEVGLAFSIDDGGRISVVLSDPTNGITVNLGNQFRPGDAAGAIDRFVFADGEVAFWQDLIAIGQAATATADVLVARTIGSSLNGLGGDDVLVGGAGDDVFSFDPNSGSDNVFELSSAVGSNDTVVVGAALADVTFSVSADPEHRDLKVTFNATGETLTINNQNFGALFPIETFQFLDGQQLSAQQVADLLNVGTADNDDIVGSTRADRIEGRAGDDRLRGGRGHDSYVVGIGSGHDVIEDIFQNDLVFGAGIGLADLSFERVGANFADLKISWNGGADSVLINGQLLNGAVQTFRFDDGSAAAWADVRSSIDTVGGGFYRGTLWNDRLAGEYEAPLDETFDGGQGDDDLDGSFGSDTYRFGRGYGRDQVFESGFDVDTIALGDGITLADLVIDRPKFSSDLVISIKGTDDQLTIFHHFDSVGRKVERLRFANGTIVSIADLTDTASGTAGDDALRAFTDQNGDVVFTPGTGNDVIVGNNGDNRVVLAAGFGVDRIRDTDGRETIEFGAGYLAGDVRFAREGYDLIITFVGSSDRVIWENHFKLHYADNYGVETLAFADGAVLTGAALSNMIANATGGQPTAGDDTLVNLPTLDGGAGNDWLEPGARTSEIVFAPGYGHDFVAAAQLTLSGTQTVRLGGGLRQADVRFGRDAANSQNIVLTIIATGETLTVARVVDDGGINHLTSVDRFLFADATTVSMSQAIDRVLQGEITAGNDEVITLRGRDGTVLDALAGDDKIIIGPAGGTVVFGAGRGHDILVPSGLDSHTRIEIRDWTWDQLSFEPVKAGTAVHIRIVGPDGSSLLIENAGNRELVSGEGGDEFGYNVWEIATVADGAYYDGEALYAAAFQPRAGAAGDDLIVGTPGDDVFEAGLGNDLIHDEGSETYDTIRFGRGDGHDRLVVEAGASFSEGGEGARRIEVHLDADIARSDVAFSLSEDGSIVLSLDGGVDTLRLDAGDWLANPSFLFINAVELTFASGRVLTGQAVLDFLSPEQIASVQMADGSVQTESEYWDWLQASDPYPGGVTDPDAAALGLVEVTLADGRVLTGQSVDDFLFPGPLASALMSDGSVFSEAEFWAWRGGLQVDSSEAFDPLTVRFASGEVVGLANIVRAQLSGTSGDDRIIAPFGDRIDPGAGNDRIFADDGASIAFGVGYGDDVVRGLSRDADGSPSFGDRTPVTVDIVGDLALEDLSFSLGASSAEDLVIHIAGTDDRLTIEGFFKGAGLAGDLEYDEAYLAETVVRFANGTVLTLGNLMNAVSGLDYSASNVITTDDAGGTLDGGGGNDSLRGGAGSDLYLFGRGYAEDAVRDTGGDHDTISFGANIAFGDLIFTRTGPDGNDLLIEVDGEERLTLTIAGQFGSTSQRIETLAFADGTRFGWADVQQSILDAAATGSADVIRAFATDDIVNARSGNDSIEGAGGNDSIDGGAGRDRVVLSGSQADYTITNLGDRIVVTDSVAGRDGSDTLYNVEDLVFAGDNSTLNLVPANIAPVAADFARAGVEDAALVIAAADALAAVSDADGTPLRLVAVRNAVGGRVWLNLAGNIVFEPSANFNGNASFDYVARDPDGAEATATVTVAVAAVNDAPAAPDVDLRTDEDTPVAGQVLATDVDGDPLGFALETGAAHGAVTLDTVTGAFNYAPGANIVGADAFTVRVSDGNGGSRLATVRVSVASVNDAPVAVGDQLDGTRNTPLVIPIAALLANDSDVEGSALSLAGVAEAENGTAALDGAGNVVFTPSTGFEGAASFYYILRDAGGQLASARVDIDVAATGGAPVLTTPLADLTASEDASFDIALALGNFTDPDGDALNFTLTQADGSALPAWLGFVDGRLVGQGPPDFNGAVELKLTASDGTNSVSDTFALTLSPVSDAPVVAAPLADRVSAEDTSIDFAIPAGSFADVDGDALTLSATLVDGGALPSWLTFAAGRFTGTPPTNFNGGYDIAVTANDGVASMSDIFRLTLAPVNDTPVANNDGLFLVHGNVALTVVPLSLLENDSDPDGDPLSIQAVSNAQHGAVTINAEGNIVFTPTFGYEGPASFDYTMTDGVSTASASVAIDVRAPFAGWWQGTPGKDVLHGNHTAENLIYGSGGDDNIKGGKLTDSLAGGDGDDHINGWQGDDHLYGMAGNDNLQGGNGFDTAYFWGLKSDYILETVGGTLRVRLAPGAPTTDGDDGIDTLTGIERLSFKNGETVSVASPIVFDLDGDGVELVDNKRTKAKFDLDGDGIRDKTGWIGKGDGILVLDRNGDGKVSGVGEISFTGDKPGAKSDLDGLSAFDSNGDGRLDSNDAKFSSFMVWRDKDRDGKVDKKELISLDKAKVAAIELQGQATEQSWAWGSNIVLNAGSFIRSDGSRGAFADVALSYAGSRKQPVQSSQRNLFDLFAAGGSDQAFMGPELFTALGDVDWDALHSNIGMASIDELRAATTGQRDRRRAAVQVTLGNDDAAFKVQRMVEAMAAFGPAGAASLRLANGVEDRPELWGIGSRYVQAM